MQKNLFIESSCLQKKHTGIYNSISNLLESLDNLDIRYTQIATNSCKYNSSFLYYNIFLPRLCRRRLNKDDVFLIPNNMGKFWRLPHVNTWVLVHDLIPLSQYGYSGIRRILYKWKMSRLKKASKIIVISEYVKKNLCETFNISPDKVSVLYWKSEDRVLKNEKRDSFYLSIGTGEPRKNLSFLINCWKSIGNGSKLILFGKEWRRGAHKEIKEQINSLGLQNSVELLGEIEDEKLYDLYSKARGFIFPSIEEGFGLPPLEALSFGCNVVLPKTPVNYELYKEIAWLYSIGSAAELKKCLDSVSNDNYSKNIEFCERFNTTAFNNKVYEIFKELTNE